MTRVVGECFREELGHDLDVEGLLGLDRDGYRPFHGEGGKGEVLRFIDSFMQQVLTELFFCGRSCDAVCRCARVPHTFFKNGSTENPHK